jgi:hypothetical protein
MKSTISSLTFASLILSAAALAGGDLTEDQVKSKVEAAGYTDVTNIHREGMHYDATAMKGGQQVTLDVNAKTGKITPEKHADKMRGHDKDEKAEERTEEKKEKGKY